eukprot:jgi/Ulvmu1/11053/UM007_0235.1
MGIIVKPSTVVKGQADCESRPKQKLPAGPPLDYSFKEIVSIKDALFETAEGGWPANPPLTQADSESPTEESCRTRRPDVVINSTAVRLANNRLSSLRDLPQFLQHVLEVPRSLRWLDLSCNALHRIPDELLDLSGLAVLYLHSNHITKVGHVGRLSALPALGKLTLHGNPVAQAPAYRRAVLHLLPGLRSLDFAPITKVDRDCAAVWARGHERRSGAQ